LQKPSQLHRTSEPCLSLLDVAHSGINALWLEQFGLISDLCVRRIGSQFAKARECPELMTESAHKPACLPPSCASARLCIGKPLLWWHPLISGDPDTIHTAGLSVRGRLETEIGVTVEEYEDRLVSWPARETGELGGIGDRPQQGLNCHSPNGSKRP